jgi:hypothetical protein
MGTPWNCYFPGANRLREICHLHQQDVGNTQLTDEISLVLHPGRLRVLYCSSYGFFYPTYPQASLVLARERLAQSHSPQEIKSREITCCQETVRLVIQEYVYLSSSS